MELEALTIPGMVHTMNHKCLCPFESRPSALYTLVKSRTNSMARVCVCVYAQIRKHGAQTINEYRVSDTNFYFLSPRWIFDTEIRHQGEV